MIIGNREPLFCVSFGYGSTWSENYYNNNIFEIITDLKISYYNSPVPENYELFWTNNNLSLVVFKDYKNRMFLSLLKIQLNKKIIEELKEEINKNEHCYHNSFRYMFSNVLTQQVTKTNLEKTAERFIMLGLKLEELNSKELTIQTELNERDVFKNYNQWLITNEHTSKQVFYFSSNGFFKPLNLTEEQTEKVLSGLDNIIIPEIKDAVLEENFSREEFILMKNNIEQKANNQILKKAIYRQIEMSPLDEDIETIISKAQKEINIFDLNKTNVSEHKTRKPENIYDF